MFQYQWLLCIVNSLSKDLDKIYRKVSSELFRTLEWVNDPNSTLKLKRDRSITWWKPRNFRVQKSYRVVCCTVRLLGSLIFIFPKNYSIVAYLLRQLKPYSFKLCYLTTIPTYTDWSNHSGEYFVHYQYSFCYLDKIVQVSLKCHDSNQRKNL